MSVEREVAEVTVDIVASVFNGAVYIGELLASLQAQTHRAWRLWVRDDGSTDATLEVVHAFAANDPRIVSLQGGGPRLGAVAGFGWALDRVPADARYVMCADHDDVWLPTKIAVTLAAMRDTERVVPGPVLVHTDLVVVDERLRPIDSSFWRYAGVNPEPVSLRRIIVQNVATGPTMMINRPLRELLAGPVPAGPVYQDWWYACVAAAFGRIVAVREPTVLYRQHGANAVGARRGARPRWFQLPGLARVALAQAAHLRSELARTTGQATALLERYGPLLREHDRRFLDAYARIPTHRFLRRKLEIVRMRLRREHGVWRNLGVLLRA